MFSCLRNISLLLVSFWASFSAQASVTISNSDLPATIQTCITGNTCALASYDSYYDSAQVSAFLSYDFNSGINYLVRYALVSPSAQNYNNTDYHSYPSVTTSTSTPYSGYLWMQINSSYSTAESAHPITLFLDKASPEPGSFLDQSGDLSLFITSSGLLAGSGSYNASCCSSSSSSNSLTGELPLVCVADGCSTFAQLNLAQLTFTQSGSNIQLTFNPTDTRGLVFTQNSLYYGGGSYNGGTTQSFYISAVPDPDAVWLFSSGLACIAFVMRRRRVAST